MWASVEGILSIYSEMDVCPITPNMNRCSKVAERVIIVELLEVADIGSHMSLCHLSWTRVIVMETFSKHSSA